MTAWTLAPCLGVLRAEVNAAWPARSKASDGTIGDAAHASRDSDHNPWVVDAKLGPVVRAFDCTAEGIDALAYAELLRQLGKAGDPRLCGGGYVIFRGRIASERDGWAWRPYTGANAHNKHVHLSVSKAAAGYSSTAGWGIARLAGIVEAARSASTSSSSPLAGLPCPGITRPGDGLRPKAPSDVTKAYQRGLIAAGYLPVGGDDGRHGPGTAAAIRKLEGDRGLKVDAGTGGPQVWQALGGAR